jgi:hypothetical protein
MTELLKIQNCKQSTFFPDLHSCSWTDSAWFRLR